MLDTQDCRREQHKLALAAGAARKALLSRHMPGRQVSRPESAGAVPGV
jgi:hypothetical protein